MAAYAIQLEYDDDVVAYYEQPPAVDCVRMDRKGVAARVSTILTISSTGLVTTAIRNSSTSWCPTTCAAYCEIFLLAFTLCHLAGLGV